MQLAGKHRVETPLLTFLSWTQRGDGRRAFWCLLRVDASCVALSMAAWAFEEVRFSHRVCVRRSGAGRKMGLDCCLSLNRHGDLLFLFPSSLAGPSSEMETSSTINLKALGAPNVVEDEIDQYLSRQDGKIYRSRDPQL